MLKASEFAENLIALEKAMTMNEIRKEVGLPPIGHKENNIITNCKNCGAILKNNICEYCGTNYKMDECNIEIGDHNE